MVLPTSDSKGVQGSRCGGLYGRAKALWKRYERYTHDTIFIHAEHHGHCLSKTERLTGYQHCFPSWEHLFKDAWRLINRSDMIGWKDNKGQLSCSLPNLNQHVCSDVVLRDQGQMQRCQVTPEPGLLWSNSYHNHLAPLGSISEVYKRNKHQLRHTTATSYVTSTWVHLAIANCCFLKSGCKNGKDSQIPNIRRSFSSHYGAEVMEIHAKSTMPIENYVEPSHGSHDSSEIQTYYKHIQTKKE